MTEVKKVIVASTNPVKLAAVERGFKKVFPDETFTFEGISVPSGVPDQPVGDAQTLEGAVNRARNAAEAVHEAAFWVGLEGGIQESGTELEAFAWMAVRGKDGTVGKGKTGTFFLPEKVAELVRQGKELGEADDIVFGHTNSKQQMGAVGILTHGVIDRAAYYTEAVVLALIPFKNPELY